jgi:hypothetical protein
MSVELLWAELKRGEERWSLTLYTEGIPLHSADKSPASHPQVLRKLGRVGNVDPAVERQLIGACETLGIPVRR